MNSFVVDPSHVDAILSVALHGPADFDPLRYPGWQPPEVGELLGGEREPLSVRNATPLGASLLEQCIASVANQSAEVEFERLPGPAPIPDPDLYEFTDFGRVLSAPECCKAIACLECQSCEHPGWPESAARAFLGDLLWRLIATLPGYQRAPWELSIDLLLARTGAAATLVA
jgi:hypothetical protein